MKQTHTLSRRPGLYRSQGAIIARLISHHPLSTIASGVRGAHRFNFILHHSVPDWSESSSSKRDSNCKSQVNVNPFVLISIVSTYTETYVMISDKDIQDTGREYRATDVSYMPLSSLHCFSVTQVHWQLVSRRISSACCVVALSGQRIASHRCFNIFFFFTTSQTMCHLRQEVGKLAGLISMWYVSLSRLCETRVALVKKWK